MLPTIGIFPISGMLIFNAFRSKFSRMILAEFISTSTNPATAVEIILTARPIIMTFPFMVTPRKAKITPYSNVEPTVRSSVTNIFPVK